MELRLSDWHQISRRQLKLQPLSFVLVQLLVELLQFPIRSVRFGYSTVPVLHCSIPTAHFSNAKTDQIQRGEPNKCGLNPIYCTLPHVSTLTLRLQTEQLMVIAVTEVLKSLTLQFTHSFRITLTFRHRASCILGQAFRYSPENAFYLLNQQIYFII